MSRWIKLVVWLPSFVKFGVRPDDYAFSYFFVLPDDYVFSYFFVLYLWSLKNEILEVGIPLFLSPVCCSWRSFSENPGHSEFQRFAA